MPDVPYALNSLCLMLRFDLSTVADYKDLPCRDHQAAIVKAAQLSKLVDPALVKCRPIVVEGDVTLAVAQAQPINAWHAATEGTAIRAEFVYSASSPVLVIRILTHLPRVDGVSATRLALHTLEAVEGMPVCSGDVEAFKRNPPYTFGFRQRMNGLGWMASIMSDINKPACCCDKPLTDEQVLAPTSLRAMRAYYANPQSAQPAQFHTYRLTAAAGSGGAAAASASAGEKAAKDGYRAFIAAVAEWHEASGFRGYFNLNNQAHVEPGAVVVSVVPKPEHLTSMAQRYKHAFTPLAHPGGGAQWKIMNALHSRVIFINNYGRHAHSFKAVPTEFLWDWTGLSAPIAGAGCITINGVFLAWDRWTPHGSAKVAAPIFVKALGPAVGTYPQLTSFSETTDDGIEGREADTGAKKTTSAAAPSSQEAAGNSAL